MRLDHLLSKELYFCGLQLQAVLVVCGSGCGSATFCGRLHHAVNECVVVGAWPAWSGQWAVVGNEGTVNFFSFGKCWCIVGCLGHHVPFCVPILVVPPRCLCVVVASGVGWCVRTV